MRCARCGAWNSSLAIVCEECGRVLPPEGSNGRPLSTSRFFADHAGASGVPLIAFTFVLILLCGTTGFLTYRLTHRQPSAVVEAYLPPSLAALSGLLPEEIASPTKPAQRAVAQAAPEAMKLVAPSLAEASPAPTPLIQHEGTQHEEDYGYHITRVRHNLRPEMARIMLDLATGPAVSEEPKYVIKIIPDQVILRIDATAAKWVSVPEHHIVKRIEMVQITPTMVEMTIDLATPIARVVDTLITVPDALVLDLYP